MTEEELTLALTALHARVTTLEQQVEIARDLLSRCLIIPIPPAFPTAPDVQESEPGSTEQRP